MAEASRLITAAELDEMTPDQRAEMFANRVVTDWGEVPETFRERVATTAERLAGQLGETQHPLT